MTHFYSVAAVVDAVVEDVRLVQAIAMEDTMDSRCSRFIYHNDTFDVF